MLLRIGLALLLLTNVTTHIFEITEMAFPQSASPHDALLLRSLGAAAIGMGLVRRDDQRKALQTETEMVVAYPLVPAVVLGRAFGRAVAAAEQRSFSPTCSDRDIGAGIDAARQGIPPRRVRVRIDMTMMSRDVTCESDMDIPEDRFAEWSSVSETAGSSR